VVSHRLDKHSRCNHVYNFKQCNVFHTLHFTSTISHLCSYCTIAFITRKSMLTETNSSLSFFQMQHPIADYRDMTRILTLFSNIHLFLISCISQRHSRIQYLPCSSDDHVFPNWPFSNRLVAFLQSLGFLFNVLFTLL